MVIFMFRTSLGSILIVFKNRFKRITHTYPAWFRADQNSIKLSFRFH